MNKKNETRTIINTILDRNEQLMQTNFFMMSFILERKLEGEYAKWTEQKIAATKSVPFMAGEGE